MKYITHLDYMILKNIPVYPEERSRKEIIHLIKQEMPKRYKNITTIIFDRVLLKYTAMYPLIEDKDICEYIFFEDLENDADCLQSTLEPIDIDWVYDHIGMPLKEVDMLEDELFTKVKEGRPEWYRQSSFKFH